MSTLLTGKVALVTGGAVRIGRAIVERLAAEGCAVVIHYHRSAEAARRLQGDLAAQGVAASVVQGQLSSQKTCERVIRTARERHGRLDILVNSAAMFSKESIGKITESSLLAEFWPNLFAPVLLTQAFAATTQRGHVVNLLDRRIAGNDPTCVPYLLTKKALAAFTEVAALALAPGIQVNAVAPGPVLPPPGKGRRYLKDHAGKVPLAQTPTVEDIAEAVLSLLRSRATTGHILFVDGGQHLLGNGV